MPQPPPLPSRRPHADGRERRRASNLDGPLPGRGELPLPVRSPFGLALRRLHDDRRAAAAASTPTTTALTPTTALTAAYTVAAASSADGRNDTHRRRVRHVTAPTARGSCVH